VVRRALSRVTTLVIIYHSHTPDGRGHCRDRPRLEQPQLISLLENELLGGWHPIGCYARFRKQAGWSIPNSGLHGLTCLSVWRTIGVSLLVYTTLETGKALNKQAYGRPRSSLFIDVAW
jgi:hypothetical protein